MCLFGQAQCEQPEATTGLIQMAHLAGTNVNFLINNLLITSDKHIIRVSGVFFSWFYADKHSSAEIQVDNDIF